DADRMRRVLASCPNDLRGWEWRYLSRVADTSVRTEILPSSGFASVTASPDGSQLLNWAGEGEIQVRDPLTWAPRWNFNPGTRVNMAAVPNSGATCVIGCPSGELRLCDLATGKMTQLPAGAHGPMAPYSITPDGSVVLVIFSGVDYNREARAVNTRT